MTDDGRMTPHRVCHCGRPVDPRNPDPWEGRMDDYCEDCATCRCDTSDSTCPHATSHTAKLQRLVDHWRDSALKVNGYDSDVGAVLLRCAWELETILEGKDA